MIAKIGRIWCSLGCVSLLAGMGAFNVRAASNSFSNTTFIVIDNAPTNPITPATPYGPAITVTGLTGHVISKLTVTLHGLSHAFPSDVSMLLLGPRGQRAIVMSETGGQIKYSVTNLTLTLDDDAPAFLPVFTNLVSGVFKPTDGYLVLGYPNRPYDFPAPAPPGNSNSIDSFSTFIGTDPNGTWTLYVLCDAAGTDKGSLSNGWSMDLQLGVPLQIARYGNSLVMSWPASATNCHLQSSSSLFDSNAWSNVVTPPVLASGSYYVTNSIARTNTFYRLVGN